MHHSIPHRPLKNGYPSKAGHPVFIRGLKKVHGTMSYLPISVVFGAGEIGYFAPICSALDGYPKKSLNHQMKKLRRCDIFVANNLVNILAP